MVTVIRLYDIHKTTKLVAFLRQAAWLVEQGVVSLCSKACLWLYILATNLQQTQMFRDTDVPLPGSPEVTDINSSGRCGSDLR